MQKFSEEEIVEVVTDHNFSIMSMVNKILHQEALITELEDTVDTQSDTIDRLEDDINYLQNKQNVV
jgi:cell division protein FtsL